MEAIIIICAILLVIFVLGANYDQKNRLNRLKGEGIDTQRVIWCGSYVGGHPSINKSIMAGFYITDGKVNIIGYNKIVADIPCDSIKNVNVENDTQVRFRVSAGRMLLFGPFAFAMKKKETDERAYLTIEWNDGRFDHATIFGASGSGCYGQMNTIRNRLINDIR